MFPAFQGPVLLSRRVARRNFLRHDGVFATSQLKASYQHRRNNAAVTQRRSLRKAFLSRDTLIIIYLHKIKWRIFYEHQPTCADNQRYSQAPINLISFNVGDGFFSLWTAEQFSKFSWSVWGRYFGMSSSCTRDNKSDRAPSTDQLTAPHPSAMITCLRINN